MPTLQDLVKGMGQQSDLPEPNVPGTEAAPQASAVLPEANLQAPSSANQAIEQLARERYGDSFVDQYGDLMGFRKSTFQDNLRNAFEIMSTGDARAPRRLAVEGAQARAEIEQLQVERAAAKRKALFDVYAFIPQGLKAKMKPATVLQLFSEQFKQITGKDPNPGVVKALMDMEGQGQTPIMQVLRGIANNQLSADDATAMGVDVGTALTFLTQMQAQEIRQQEVNQSGERIGDSKAREQNRQAQFKQRQREQRVRRRDQLLKAWNPYGSIPTAEQVIAANRMAGLPRPSTRDIQALRAASEGGGGAPPALPAGGGGAGGPITVRQLP